MSRESTERPNHRQGGNGTIQLWGGTECTVNRVGDRYNDQLVLTGHDRRLSDLDLFANLGIRALRYPVLWERVALSGLERADWRWADERLERIRALGMDVIAGLVHHGSGPRHTSLVDPDFPVGLARFACAVAERYPWVRMFTPVNEPLTTARFSALYGHWYPHARDDRAFVRALLTQCRGVVLAMDAIRQVNPSACLVQTDDLGRTSSTPLLRYQAEYENERRWITFDLLSGRVHRDHPLWGWLTRNGGASEANLMWFVDHPCPPDIMGINHYLSSERYLDEDLNRYPPAARGGNRRHRYADELTARVRDLGPYGPLSLLREAWERFRITIAVTEAHNGCTREEQMRWFTEVWQAAETARAEGIDVHAVTAWSLLGVQGWDRLVTGGGRYEPGVFDVRGPEPRPTAMAGVLQSLSGGTYPEHPVLSVPGWWHRPDRHIYGFVRRDDGSVVDCPPVPSINQQVPFARPLLITGARGTLGRAFAVACERRGIPYRALRRGEMDIADEVAVRAAVQGLRPWAVVNTAGYVRVDEAEFESERCFRENTGGAAVLGEVCGARGLPFVTFSSDLVFDGSKRTPYLEDDPALPINTYGRSKAAAESRVRQAHPDALIVRTSAFFSPADDANFVVAALRAATLGQPVRVPPGTISPTYVPDLVEAALDLLIDGAAGIRHLANAGTVSWSELALLAADAAGIGRDRIETVQVQSLPAPRPLYSVLGTGHGQILRSLDEALEQFCAEAGPRLPAALAAR